MTIWKYWCLGNAFPMIRISAAKKIRVRIMVNPPKVTGNARQRTYGTLEMGEVPSADRVTRLIPRPMKKRPRTRQKQRLTSPKPRITGTLPQYRGRATH